MSDEVNDTNSRINPVTRACNSIGVCDWNETKEKWLNHIPNISPPGSNPTNRIGSKQDFIDEAVKASQCSSESPWHECEIEQIHQDLLHEAVFLLHKAQNVLSAAEQHATNGYPSWSLSSGYHAAFFALKSVMTFLGFPLIDYGKKMALVELFPAVKPDSKGEISVEPAQSVIIVDLGMTFGHQNIWIVFQRMLNQLSIDEQIIDSSTKKFLGLCVEKNHFAKERNRLHYHVDFWPQADLYSGLTLEGFGKPTKTRKKSKWEFDYGGYSLWLGQTIFSVGVKIFCDLSLHGGILKDEFDLFDKCVDQLRHPIWHEELAIQ